MSDRGFDSPDEREAVDPCQGAAAGSLRRLAALRAIPDPLLAEIERACAPFCADPGVAIFRQEREANHVYFLLGGSVGIWIRSLGDEQERITTLPPGSLFGEVALLEQGRRSTTARAEGAVSGLRLSRARFAALCDASPPAAMALLDALAIQTAGRISAVIEGIRLVSAGAVRGPIPGGSEGDPADADQRRDQPADQRGDPADADQRRDQPADQAGDPALIAMIARLQGAARLAAADLLALPAARVAGLGRLRRLQRGAALAEAGAASEEIWLVLSGAIRSSLPGRGPGGAGWEQLLIHGPGSLAGVPGAVAARPREARIEAREEGWALEIPRLRLEALQAQSSPLAFALTSACAVSLASDLRQLNRHLARQRALRRASDPGAPLPEAPCAG